jgi:alpha-ketoglutarate-dependent taurine dioxygenase
MIATNISPSTSGFELTPLKPFGLLLQAREPGADPRSIPVGLLRRLTCEHQLLLMRGFAPFESPEAMSRYCTSWGELYEWPFGTVLDLVEHAKPQDSVFDHTYLPMHWDGMYVSKIPAFQFFQCIQAPEGNDGGQTTFSNTLRILEDVDERTRALWERVTVTYRIRQMAHYGGVVRSPLITPHPETGAPVLRYNEPPPEGVEILNRTEFEYEGIPATQVRELREGLRAAIHDPRHLYAHEWRTGDMVVADNYVLLHGRMAFTRGSRRHLRRVHILGNPPFENPAIM